MKKDSEFTQRQLIQIELIVAKCIRDAVNSLLKPTVSFKDIHQAQKKLRAG